MLDQQDDTDLDAEWLIANERLTSFRKDRNKNVGRVKVSESSSVQWLQYYEEDLVVRERVASSTETPSVIKPRTDGKHATIGQAQNDGSSESQ